MYPVKGIRTEELFNLSLRGAIADRHAGVHAGQLAARQIVYTWISSFQVPDVRL